MPNDSNPLIVVLARDLFFGVRIRQVGTELGYRVQVVNDATGYIEALEAEPVALGVVDINARPDWDEIARTRPVGGDVPILAFGPHLDVDGLRAAKAAGVTRVVSNGQFHREAAELLRRYARSEPAN